MKKQENKDRKPTEALSYYAGKIEIDGKEVCVLFTENELKRPTERAKNQPEEFEADLNVGIFSTIFGWFKKGEKK